MKNIPPKRVGENPHQAHGILVISFLTFSQLLGCWRRYANKPTITKETKKEAFGVWAKANEPLFEMVSTIFKTNLPEVASEYSKRVNNLVFSLIVHDLKFKGRFWNFSRLCRQLELSEFSAQGPS